MATDLVFPGWSFASRLAPAHTVYTRSNWADAWTAAGSGVQCTEAVWSVAPSISTATLEREWGQVAPRTSTNISAQARLDLIDQYVKIVFQLEYDASAGSWSTVTWYGVVRVQEDSPTIQRWACYGMEVLLAEHRVFSSWWRERGKAPVEIERGLTFNRGGKPNLAVHAWEGVYYFGTEPDTNGLWTTKDAIEYLLRRQTPTDKHGNRRVPFRLTTYPVPGLPPAWDRPELYTHGVSTWDLLCQLLPRQRLMGFKVGVSESSTPADVVIYPFSWTAEAIPVELPDAAPIPANPNQWRIDFTASPETVYSLKLSTIDKYDQTIARGNRRRAVCTLGAPDSTLEAGWTSTHETAYEAGASGATAWAGASVAERERMNAEVRGGVQLSDVYARFAIPRDWDGQASNGQGGTKAEVFAMYVPGGIGYPGRVYDLDLEIEPTLPLLEGVDYSGTKISAETFDESDATGREMAAACFWKIPNTSPQRWAPVDTLGRSAAAEEESETEQHKWSGNLSVDATSRAVRLEVIGEPQHVIAEIDFAGQAGCNDADLGDNDWREAVFTVSILEDRYAQGTWPESIATEADVVRTLHIDAGPAYLHDNVAPRTVIDVDEDSALVTTDGGILHDDRDKLIAIARASHAWYGSTRRALTLATEWRGLLESVARGEFITAFVTTAADGDDADPDDDFYAARQVNSVISEISIETPRVRPGQYAAPRVRLVTACAELDALVAAGEVASPPAKAPGETFIPD